MNLPPLVPPLKCQGIKTKLVGDPDAVATLTYDNSVSGSSSATTTTAAK